MTMCHYKCHIYFLIKTLEGCLENKLLIQSTDEKSEAQNRYKA